MNATREKKLQFIKSFGPRALKERLCSMIDELGDDFLNDAQISLMAERHIEDARRANTHKIRERNRAYKRTSLPFLAAAE